MAEYNYEIKSENYTIPFKISSKPNISDEQKALRVQNFRAFSENLVKKFKRDLTPNQIEKIGISMQSILERYTYGELDFNFNDILNIKPNDSKVLVETFKKFEEQCEKHKPEFAVHALTKSDEKIQ